MAKLYFRYGCMNSGKTTAVLQVAHNYEEKGLKVLLIKPSIDKKGDRNLVSRLGISRQVDVLLSPTDNINDTKLTNIACIIVDEAQFLTPKQVDELFWITIQQKIPVIAYGLRTDFMTQAFPGAERLLALAHTLEEYKTICRCGKKAVFNSRIVGGEFVKSGSQVAIDGFEGVEYEALCGECYQRFVLN